MWQVTHATVRQLNVARVRGWVRAAVWIACVLVVGLAFGLRAWGVRWGLPYVDHPDEPALVDVALRMLRDGDPNPHFFLYPSLYFYLLVLVFQAHLAWAQLTGAYGSANPLEGTTHLFTTIPLVFVWGRLLTATIGTLTAVLAYRLVRQAVDGRSGLLAALFVATLPFHVRHSQYITTDVTAAVLLLLALIGMVGVAQGGRQRSYLVAGLGLGLAAAVKYNLAVIAAGAIAAHGLYWRRAWWRRLPRLVGAGLAALFGFVSGTPYALLAWPEFLAGLERQLQHYAAGVHGDMVGRWPLADYATFFWREGLLPPAAIATLIGMASMLWADNGRWRAFALVWLGCVLPYLALLLLQATHFVRNLLPVLVACALPVAVAGRLALARLMRVNSLRWPWRVMLSLGVLGALYLWPAQHALAGTLFVAQPDSRVLAEAYIKTLPRGARIAVELNPLQWAGDPIVEPVPFVTARPLEWYRANAYRYLVARASERDPADQALYERLRAGAQVIRVFPGVTAGQPGPRLEVLDLGIWPAQLKAEPRPAVFGEMLQLLGYELEAGALRPAITPLDGARREAVPVGSAVQLNLYWRVWHPLPQEYAFFIHVLDAAGRRVAQRDTLLRADDYPARAWQRGELVVERGDLQLPVVPPGRYQLWLGIYDMPTGQRLPVVAATRNDDPGALLLTTLEVR
ncbi:glycosyltransferase family 39 protein [Kallotenue papyrolyticum]|uniref:glycosyltransferase family 39 protein n=1 Tax=Kallotenue papyrolyticum TaxID=1325125 RepID=UPI0004785EFB|nr:glycosyltransferase family 39 protein [Kallotenue papyrolyticum]